MVKHYITAVFCALFLTFSYVGCSSGGDDGTTAAAPDTGGADTTTDGAAVASYVGSDVCGQCHGAIKAVFDNNGHQYKLSKVVDGQMPTYPFSSLEGAWPSDDDADIQGGLPDPVARTDNSLGTPVDYYDISYVIGGFGWKARWIDADGYIITGSAVQYNLDGSYSAYHNNQVDKKYNCGNCHTTGWRATTTEEGDDRNNATQDNLPGMAGTFYAPGVHCEACHGAGSLHVESGGDTSKITKIATARTTADFLAEDQAYGKPVACSECHTRNGEKNYPAYVSAYEGEEGVSETVGGMIDFKGGLIRHHEQFDELLGVNPDSPAAGSTRSAAFQSVMLNCIVCHNQHATTKYQDISGDPPGMDIDCSSCHADKAITSAGMASLDCKDCHMPRMVKSAINTFKPVDDSDDRPALGDIRTHIFRIDLSAATQSSESGKAYPWITGGFACKRCHSANGIAFNLDFPSTITIHN